MAPGLECFGPALSLVFLDHFLEIVNIVEIDIVQIINGRVDITRHGNIYEEHGTVPPPAQDVPHVIRMNDGFGGSRGTDDDIRARHDLENGVKGYGFSADTFRQFPSAFQSTVGYQDTPDAGLNKMHGRQLGHFSRTYEQRLMLRHIVKDSFRQLHRCIADGNRTGGDSGFRTHPLGYGKSLVQKAVHDEPALWALLAFR